MSRLLLLMPEHFIHAVYPLFYQHLHDVEIVTLSVNANPEEIARNIRHADFLIFTGITINLELLSKASNLRLIQKWGSGIDGIDLLAAKQLGIPIANIPGGNATAVAEHFFALMLALYKKICLANDSIHAGRWLQPEIIATGITELSGKKLGIVGLGKIGRSILSRAIAFEMKCIYYQRNRLNISEEQTLKVSYASLVDLVHQADIVGLTLPLTSQTQGLFDYGMLLRMQPSSILINVSRGQIINESDLYRALNEGKIAGAGLDVFECEPPSQSDPLLQLPNVVATPHTAGRTREAITYITEQCAVNIRLVEGGKQPQNIVLAS